MSSEGDGEDKKVSYVPDVSRVNNEDETEVGSTEQSSAAPGLNGCPTSAGASSHGYSTSPPSPTTQAVQEGEIIIWLETQGNRRTGPSFLRGLSPPPSSEALVTPTAASRVQEEQGFPQQGIVDEDINLVSGGSALAERHDTSLGE